MNLRIRLSGEQAEELSNDLLEHGMAQNAVFDGGGYVLDCGEMALPPGANADDEKDMRTNAEAIVEGLRGMAFNMNVKIEVL